MGLFAHMGDVVLYQETGVPAGASLSRLLNLFTEENLDINSRISEVNACF